MDVLYLAIVLTFGAAIHGLISGLAELGGAS